ncbi:unnamed protein product [Somion occarium]|uniref:Glyoxal oxidase n=1 Tax=Somion occarium TaxID=3059160 RepID=A0ABP1DVZ0_9APHY
MLNRQLSLLALGLAAATPAVLSQKPGSFEDGGDTLVSAMMLLLGNDEKVYILDKSEGNPAQINGHPAMGAVYDIATRKAQVMDVTSNVFCASGMHLPNGSFITLGGNGAIGPGGNIGSVQAEGGGSGLFDETYQDYDGTRAIRILNPCTGDATGPACEWFDDANVLAMQKHRWYSTAEPLGDGSIAIIGGFTNGGYVNRNYPNLDPAYEGGAAEPTFEFFPSRGEAQVMQFIVDTSGLNAYPHTYTLPSGKLFLQANISSMIWDPDTNSENRLPNMPENIVRVYPASGAVAMLPLTPANNWTPTILFCGGSDMPDYAWGNYSWPYINTWEYPASAKCHRITPEPSDNSSADYEEDDPMLETRTMGQFIALPDGTMMVVNGGLNGTAGYSTQTLITTSYSDMPYGMSLASGPVGTPGIYDPRKPKGQRWSNTGLDASEIPRLYHSSALLLPDASVLIAGSNPNVDVNTSTIFPTTYKAEIFYPSYFSAKTRPTPQGVPKTISYGGDKFDITVPAASYSGAANDAADSAAVMLMRPGFTTHAMNMGQRSMQLNNTYTVNSDGSLTLHVAQAPPNSNIFQPGPALLFVTINGIPSNGTYVIVGNGQIGKQPTAAASTLPANVRLDSVKGTGEGGSSTSNTTSNNSSGASHTGPIIGAVVGAIALQDNPSMAWNASSLSVNSPYLDQTPAGARSGGQSVEFDPYYQNTPRMSTAHGQR